MSMKLWVGRTDGKTDDLFSAINDSLPVDVRLISEDIAGSIAWAQALARAEILTRDEADAIESALRVIEKEALEDPEAVVESGAEDIHTWVESALTERIGDLGKKLHTGRSRNDQVATDLRLWVIRAVDERLAELRSVVDALLELARRELGTVLPGYTHLQRAQPVLFSHWCMAYHEMLGRDRGRLIDARARTARCPLGVGALSGTAYPIDRQKIAEDLGFIGPSANSLDAVSDRDFVVETLAAISLSMVHLSRMAEDLIFYASAEAGYVEFDDTVTSGSSMMPQKKNPDAMELVRGKTGGAIGTLVSMLTTLKGLPLAYNKDLQEDKAAIFRAMDDYAMSLRITSRILQGLQVNHERTREAARENHSNATELADLLVRHGVPFRDAHAMCGRLVRQAIEKGATLEDLSIEQIRQIAPEAPNDVQAHLTIDAALQRRSSFGGTSLEQVKAAISSAQSSMQKHSDDPPVASNELAAVTIEPAHMGHVDDIARLVDYWAVQGENLPRRRESIIASIAEFAVARQSGEVIGCGSLLIYESTLAEIRSLGVDPNRQGAGAGKALVEYLLERAARLHVPQVFVLTRAPKFFERCGFHTVDISTLPEKVFKDCSICPKQYCCDEIAMVCDITPADSDST